MIIQYTVPCKIYHFPYKSNFQIQKNLNKGKYNCRYSYYYKCTCYQLNVYTTKKSFEHFVVYDENLEHETNIPNSITLQPIDSTKQYKLSIIKLVCFIS